MASNLLAIDGFGFRYKAVACSPEFFESLLSISGFHPAGFEPCQLAAVALLDLLLNIPEVATNLALVLFLVK